MAAVDPQKSWVISEDSLGLIHEQRHFDIVEIYARKFNNEYSDEKIRAKVNQDALQFKRFHEMEKEINEIQARYDKETNHSQNRLEQVRWNEWIKKQLDSIPKIEFE